MKISPPQLKDLSEILPPKNILLMGAGPVPVPREVAEVSSIVISHLGDAMKEITNNIQKMSQYVFQTTSNKIFGIAGPSSAAMEMAITSTVWPGRKVLVLNLGTFSARFAQMSENLGGEVTHIYPENKLTPIWANQVEEILSKKKFDVLTVVQGETSCGIKNIDIPAIMKVAKKYHLTTIVDVVSTLSTTPFQMDEWEVDITFVGGQKGLSSFPGTSLIAFSESCFQMIQNRKNTMPHWCLDPLRAYEFWGKHEYHYTAPVNGLISLHQALKIICTETLEARIKRHENSSQLLQNSLIDLGLELLIPKDWRLKSVIAICKPAELSIDSKQFIKHMISTYQVEIAGAFGLNIFRVGQMGEQCRLENIKRLVHALGQSLLDFKVSVQLEKALVNFDQVKPF